jgi:molybdopterin/thiamine biosynthesis adenylyltransferase
MLKRKYPSAKRRIHVVPAFIQESLAKPRSIFDKSDLVICMVDNDSTRDWVNYHCVNKKRNLIITGMSGPGMEWGGYVMSIKPGQTACFRCLAGSASVAGLGNEHEPKNTVPTDDSNVRRHECGVGDNLPVAMISPVVGLISNLVAIAALKALLDFPEQPNYIYYEARRNMWRTHELKRAKDCAHCAVTSGSSGLILLPKGKLTRIAPEIGKS